MLACFERQNSCPLTFRHRQSPNKLQLILEGDARPVSFIGHGHTKVHAQKQELGQESGAGHMDSPP